MIWPNSPRWCPHHRLELNVTMPVDDIRRLAREIGLTTAQEALDLVAMFYPDRVVEPRTRFGLKEIFDRLAEGEDAPREGTPRS
jgi:hypothetical protein